MTQTLYLAFHRLKTLVLLSAEATPLVMGAKGSPLELVLNTLYFRSEFPEPMRYTEAVRLQ